jgi:hypothetical protein
MEAILIAPADGRFAVEEVEVAPPQRPVQGIRKLVAAASASTTVQFAVVFQPADPALAAPKIVPLDQWPSEPKHP